MAESEVAPAHRLIRQLERELADKERRLARRTAQLREMASRLSAAEQRERRRLAEFFHDHLQQLLVGAKMTLEGLDAADVEEIETVIARTIDLLDQAIRETRDLSRDLYPPDLRIHGLPDALAALVEQMEEQYPLDLSLVVDSRVEPLDEDLAGFLYDAAQELLLNVVKHAGTREAWVRYGETTDGRIRLEVRDEGRGFPVDLADRDSFDELHGLGLLRIRERLAAYGGRMTVTSETGGGSRVEILAPRESRSARAGSGHDG